MSDDLVERLREVSFEKHQEAWGRLDGGQDLTIGAMLAEQAADRIEELEAKLGDSLVVAEAKLNDQTHLIEQLFALLDIKEQKDDGRYFHPNIIRSSRALDAEKLEEILVGLRRSVTEYNKPKE